MDSRSYLVVVFIVPLVMSDEAGTRSLAWAATQSARSQWTQRYLFPYEMEAGSMCMGVNLLQRSYWLGYK